MNKIIFCLIALLAITACMKDDAYIVSSTAELTFSTDTVALDTVIAGQGSNTYTFEVYNKQNKAIRITRVWLENGAASDFKVNVDGSALTSGETNDLEIAAKDSMRVFLFVKTKDLNADTPQRTSDKLYFQTEGGFIGVVILNAFGQSVTTFKGKVIERDTILSSRRPYQIYDSLVIAKGATLNVSPGVRFYFHPGAQLIVHGKLLARGTLSSPIIMRGDRLGNMFSQQAYDNIPGQWGGVVFTQESFNNELDFVDIHSGNFGIRCDSSAVSQLKLKLTNSIVHNTKGDGEKSGEDFWVKAEKLYYTALIGYIWYEAPKEEKNFATLLDMIDASEVREEDESYMNPIDRLFEALEKRNPTHFAVKQYKKYKLAAGKTAKSILISCGARLAPFDIQELRDLMMEDELELDRLGDRKTALFVIISDTDDTFNFVVSIMYSQLFNLLCDKADDVYGGRLPVHVRCLLDEFPNIGLIPKFEKLIATIRSREISASIILQAQSQLKAIYKDSADTIVGNCDSTLFLGGKEKTTLKELSETLGKETIDLYNTSETRSNQKSFGLNYQKVGKDLMSQDEITVMDGGKCIFQLRGVRPFLSDKFDITKHKNYKLLEDYDKRNIFDIEGYIKQRGKVELNENSIITRLR